MLAPAVYILQLVMLAGVSALTYLVFMVFP